MRLANKGWIIAFFLYFLILLTIMLLADQGRLFGVLLLLAKPPYDKLGHFILYGIASFLSHRAIGRRMMAIFNYPIPVGPLIFSIFTVVEEMLQAILPNRTASIEDGAASMLGILVFYWIGVVLDRKIFK